MPAYDYECTECGKQFEEMVSLSEYNKEVKCPECGKKADRLITVKPPIHSSWKHWRL